MEYTFLEEAGTLEVNFEGGFIDLYTLGILSINLQDIVDKVAFATLSQEGLLEPSWKRPRYLPIKPPATYRRLVRLEVHQAGTGSFFESLTFAVVSVIADPDVRAVLTNLGSNVIWGMLVSGVRGIRQRNCPPPPDTFLFRRGDILDIGPNLRDTLLGIAENIGNRTAEVRIRHRAPHRETLEVTWIIRGNTAE